MWRKLTSKWYDHTTLNKAPVPHWPWLEALREEGALSWHKAITSWLRHDRCELSNFLHFWLTQWDNSRLLSSEPERSLQLQRNSPQGYLLCFLVFAVYPAVCDQSQKREIQDVMLQLINRSHPLSTVIRIPTIHNYYPVFHVLFSLLCLKLS